MADRIKQLSLEDLAKQNNWGFHKEGERFFIKGKDGLHMVKAVSIDNESGGVNFVGYSGIEVDTDRPSDLHIWDALEERNNDLEAKNAQWKIEDKSFVVATVKEPSTVADASESIAILIAEIDLLRSSLQIATEAFWTSMLQESE